MTDAPAGLRRSDDLPEVGMTVREMVLGHEKRLRAIEDWRVEMRTIATILKLTFGVSLLGAAVGVLNLIDMLSRTPR